MKPSRLSPSFPLPAPLSPRMQKTMPTHCRPADLHEVGEKSAQGETLLGIGEGRVDGRRCQRLPKRVHLLRRQGAARATPRGTHRPPASRHT